MATRFTVQDAKIPHALFMFDRLPYEEARQAAAAGAVAWSTEVAGGRY